MSAHRTLVDILKADHQIPDPGASGTIYVDRSPGVVQIVTATAESRTLARPTDVGWLVTIHMKTDGGDCTLTVTGGYNEDGDTTFTLSDPGQFVAFQSFYDGTNYYWRKISDYATANIPASVAAVLDGVTASAAELNTLHNQTIAGTAAAGITGGTGTVIKYARQKSGDIYKTQILVDLTGLGSSTTDLDIIGQGASAAYIALLTAAECGATILAVSMQCLETPAGGVTDIDLYSASEGTGKFDDAVTGLTETALITSGGAWANGTTKAATVVPLSTEYIYLTGGAGGTAGTYSAGKFLITIYGYD